MSTTKRQWREYPAAVLIETKYGPVSVTCTGPGMVFVGFGGTTFPAPALSVRGVEYYGSNHFQLQPDGTLQPYNGHFSARRVADFKDPSDSARRELLAASGRAAYQFTEAYPDLMRAGAAADVNNDILRAADEVAKQRDALAAAEATLAALLKREAELP